MTRLGLGLWGGTSTNDPPDRCHEQLERFRAAGVTLPIVYPIHPEFRNYLPDPAARAGLFRTIEELGGA